MISNQITIKLLKDDKKNFNYYIIAILKIQFLERFYHIFCTVSIAEHHT